MKIALFDPYLDKFTDGMQKWWKDHGYEVQASRYYDPQLAEWADTLWFETCDNNLASATNPGSAIMDDSNNYQPWDIHDMPKKHVIVRAIDIEVWQGHHGASLWDKVDDLIFIAPHIRNLVEIETLPAFNPNMKVHIVSCAVDLDKWTYKEREPGFNIAVVSERWNSKGVAEILQVAYKLKQLDERYKITWLGQRSDYQWEHAYRDEFVEHNNLNIEFINILNDGSTVDQFLEDKNYLLHGSHKEGFSYATAEAMAKGIKPVVHRFFGADDIWPGMTWNGIDEAINMIVDGSYDSASYRQYLIDHGYTLPQMMEKFDAIINNKEL